MSIFSEKRCKYLMLQLGQPDSKSLMSALNQVANEVEQKTRLNTRGCMEQGRQLAEKDKEIERLREQVGNIEQLKADAIDEMVDKLTGLELHGYNTLLINDVIEYADSLRKDTELER